MRQTLYRFGEPCRAYAIPLIIVSLVGSNYAIQMIAVAVCFALLCFEHSSDSAPAIIELRIAPAIAV